MSKSEGIWDAAERQQRAQISKLGDDIAKAINALKVKNAEGMAKAAYEVLRAAAKAEGMSPDIEVLIREPGQPRYFSDATCWVVGWEAGPYQWAIPVSMQIGSECGKLCEPYYSFDLCFYPSEDA